MTNPTEAEIAAHHERLETRDMLEGLYYAVLAIVPQTDQETRRAACLKEALASFGFTVE